MNALADARVADHFNANFICTYVKVGTFRIVNGQKVGGNVASYFCLAEGSVLHAVPGPVNAAKLLTEARWASETRKSAQLQSTDLATGDIDVQFLTECIRAAHLERYESEAGRKLGNHLLPKTLPRNLSKQAQAHWLLAKNSLAELGQVYPVVWTQILGEQLSGLPVAKQ